MFKMFPFFVRDFPGVNIAGESLDTFVRSFDICAKLRGGRQRGIPQPIMANHPFLIGIGDCSRFKLPHCRKRLVDLRLHFLEEIVGKSHPTNVERETEIVVVHEILLKTLPKRRGRHDLQHNRGKTSMSSQ